MCENIVWLQMLHNCDSIDVSTFGNNNLCCIYFAKKYVIINIVCTFKDIKWRFIYILISFVF